MKIMITGSNGFIGTYISNYLENHGHEILRVVRYKENACDVKRFHTLDFEKMEASQHLFQAVDAVIHLAGLAHIPEKNLDLLDARKINVTQTLNLASQAKKNGISKFVFLSSVKVLGEDSGDSFFSDTSAPTPTTVYGNLKWEAEEALRHLFDKKMSFLFVRAPLVYGPLVKANFLSLLKIINTGLPLPLRSVQSYRSLLFVGNLADAIHCYLINDNPESGAYLLCDGDAQSIPAICHFLGESLNRKVRLFSVPKSFLSWFPGGSKLTSSLVISDSTFRSHFSWDPPFTLNDGLAETAKWYMTRQ